MCSNQTLKCLLNTNKNASIISEAYDAKTYTQIKIYFKNKFKLCTGIDCKTTFNDLKLALLMSFYKSKYAASKSKSKLAKNYEALKNKALNDYVICESVNTVEKVIDSNLYVLNELKRISHEEMFLGDLKVLHIMRSKRKLVPLPTLNLNSLEEDEVPILREFYSPTHDKSHSTTQSLTTKLIDLQLEKFDQFIEQRKAYINLLEQYLNLLDLVKIDSNLETLV